MKSISLVLLLFLLDLHQGQSQGLTQNAEGQSTILFKGNSIGFDIGKTEISFGINNLNKNPTTKDEKGNHYWIKGLSIKAGSEEGISNLFSKGNLVPAGSLQGFTGWNFSNLISNATNFALDNIRAEQQLYDSNFLSSYKISVQEIIEEKSKRIADRTERELFVTTLSANLNDPNSKSLGSFIGFLRKRTESSASASLALIDIIAETKVILKGYEEGSKKIRERFLKEQEKWETKKYWKLLLFVYGGIDAMSFKRFDSFSVANLSGSFSDIDDRGGHLGLGVNYQIGVIKIGLTYDYFSTNNFGMLNKGEYTFRNTVSSGGQSLIQEKKVTAYSGKYGEVEINRLSFDLTAAFKLDKEANNHLLVNPYFRGNFFSRDTSLMLNTINIGTGFYLFKKTGKFMGGFYFELPDLNNNIEKKKKEEDQNIRPALKRLTFGVVGRISLSSFLSKQ